MSQLKEFLTVEGNRQMELARENHGGLSAWLLSVNQLFQWMESRLKEVDEKNFLGIERKAGELREEGIGRYEIPRLLIRFFAREVEVIPISLRIAGRFEAPNAPAMTASGRIDITDGIQKFPLYRFVVQESAPPFGHNRWMFLNGHRDQMMTPLDADTFERAVERLLR